MKTQSQFANNSRGGKYCKYLALVAGPVVRWQAACIIGSIFIRNLLRVNIVSRITICCCNTTPPWAIASHQPTGAGGEFEFQRHQHLTTDQGLSMYHFRLEYPNHFYGNWMIFSDEGDQNVELWDCMQPRIFHTNIILSNDDWKVRLLYFHSPLVLGGARTMFGHQAVAAAAFYRHHFFHSALIETQLAECVSSCPRPLLLLLTHSG